VNGEVQPPDPQRAGTGAEGPASSPHGPDVSAPSELVDLREEEAVGGVLRWLLAEIEAEAVAYLRLGPGGVEQFRVEPRGLDPQDLVDLVGRARDALVAPGRETAADGFSATRWLGVGGSKVIVVRGSGVHTAEALRLARFAIEWLSAARGGIDVLELRARTVSGVAWAELVQKEPPVLRVLLVPTADEEEVRRALAEAAPDAKITIEEPSVLAPAAEEPRARLVDISVGMNNLASAEVRLEFAGRELRGRGRGRPSASGRSYAAAEAVADAMKPVIEGDVRIEGVYEADVRDGFALLVVAIRVAGDHYVGAVFNPSGQEDVSGARAVLDALNRRLPRIAGRSGYF
jgi:hypothetical protein